MNNFQLNNTSVYLGGQCKWDIVLSNDGSQLYVSGFQLTPISENIPFNKRGTVDKLNDDHSYTLKKFHNDIKENFWSINPNPNQKITHQYVDPEDESKNYTEDGYYDSSFIAGLKRSSTFQVYNRQLEYLLPIWLEKVDNGKYLKFSFDICSGSGGERRVLDSKMFDLKPIESTDKIYEFHNKFVNYFYNWLKSLHIDEGNNKVLNIDIQKAKAEVDGVSIISGQKSDVISCDYVCNNLLSYERPNIETDYILSTLFKAHDLITSQLFNLNFCFNLNDVVNPFFINQLNGTYVSMGCTAYVDNEELERRSLFTNYQFINKEIWNSCLFLDDTEIETGSANILKKNYVVLYGDDFDHAENNTPEDDEKVNVLDYLRDYNNKKICDVNKILQHVIHWDFTEHNQNIFNLYGGYSGLNTFPFDIDSYKRFPGVDHAPTQYVLKLYDLIRTSSSDYIYTTDSPIASNGALNWILPTKIIYVGSTSQNPNPDDIRACLIRNIKLVASGAQSVLKLDADWNINKTPLKNLLNSNNANLTNFNLSFIYINDNSGDYGTVFAPWSNIALDLDDAYIFKNNDGIGDHYVIVSKKNSEYFSIEKLSNISVTDNNFSNYIQLLKDIIKLNDSKYNFYGFYTELEIGKDDEDRECYYKSNKRKTFLYRRCGLLTPCFKSDDSFGINYQYYQLKDNNSILQITPDGVNNFYTYNYEYKLMEDNKIFDVMNELHFTDITKTPSDTDTLEKKIKDKIADTYHIDPTIETNKDLIDYIYGLYDISYNFEEIFDTTQGGVSKTTKYDIKMILK